jgi:hypothetical protein
MRMKDGGLNCYDCDKASPQYMVKDEVWSSAWPRYREMKAALSKKYPRTLPSEERVKGLLTLCLYCLEQRLGRPLKADDFDLELPINHTIALGMRIERRQWP